MSGVGALVAARRTLSMCGCHSTATGGHKGPYPTPHRSRPYAFSRLRSQKNLPVSAIYTCLSAHHISWAALKDMIPTVNRRTGYSAFQCRIYIPCLPVPFKLLLSITGRYISVNYFLAIGVRVGFLQVNDGMGRQYNHQDRPKGIPDLFAIGLIGSCLTVTFWLVPFVFGFACNMLLAASRCSGLFCQGGDVGNWLRTVALADTHAARYAMTSNSTSCMEEVVRDG